MPIMYSLKIQGSGLYFLLKENTLIIRYASSEVPKLCDVWLSWCLSNYFMMP